MIYALAVWFIIIQDMGYRPPVLLDVDYFHYGSEESCQKVADEIKERTYLETTCISNEVE